MGVSQSNLSQTGFDFVVAVTQNSINGTLEEYLFSGLPEAILCYVYNNNNIPVPIDYQTLIVKAQNTDPFSVPAGTPSSDPRVQNLNNAAFAFAIKAKLGLPPGVPPSKLPPILQLQAGQSNVIYTLMFSEFVATTLVFGPRGSITWFNEAQQSGTPWTFTGTVNLNFQSAAFQNLSPDAQQELERLGSPNQFSVQQLYYDLNSSDLEQGFQFSNIPSNSALNAFMTADFINTYWKQLGGSEILGYGAKQSSGVQTSSLAVTNLNFFTPNAAGNEGAPLTLNYLCAATGDPLPATSYANFGWNWIEPGESTNFDGAAALNRNTLAQYLHNNLASYIASNCYAPWVKVTYIGGIPIKVGYAWSMASNQSATVTIPPSGSEILNVTYTSTASDQAGDNGAAGRMELSCTYTLTVTVQGTQMTVVQHMVLYLYVRNLATSASGNGVDKQITDVYSFGVSDQGELVVSKTASTTVDNSQTPSASGFLNFFADVNDLAADVVHSAQSLAAITLQDVPASAVQSFVFPGGVTFSFSDVAFSDNQDLVSHIVYVNAANLEQQKRAKAAAV